MTIAQAKIIFPSANLKAIYADDKMVGFTMFGLDEDDGKYYLGRLMIDEKHQGKGLQLLLLYYNDLLSTE